MYHRWEADQELRLSRRTAKCGRAVGGLLGDAGADEAAEVEDDGELDGVDRAISVGSAVDDAGGEEQAELFGDVGLLEAGLVDEFTDAGGSGLEYLEDAEAAGFGECGE